MMNSKYMLNELRQLALTAWLDSKQEEKEIKFYYESILNDLNRLEKLENNIDNLKIENVDLKLRNKELEKVIEILKKKKEDINLILFSNNYDHYIASQGPWEDVLTEEEFNLLKEVLNYGK